MAKEGFAFFLPFVAITVIFFYLFNRQPRMIYIYLGVASYILACLFVLFFRDPQRNIAKGEDLIVSPADGKILSIEKQDGQVRLTIFLSIFNVHVNRVPVDGKVIGVRYKPGKFLAAFKKEASDVNERFEIDILTDKGKVTVHQIAGILARRVVCRLSEGQYVARGQRFGLIRFGSRVDLFMPEKTELFVKVGNKVKGGETVIGKLN